jgi:hypothetical protein
LNAMAAKTISFRFGKEGFSVQARKSRDCAEAYIGTPHNFACKIGPRRRPKGEANGRSHKRARRLTPHGRKRTLSGRKLIDNGPYQIIYKRHIIYIQKQHFLNNVRFINIIRNINTMLYIIMHLISQSDSGYKIII